MGRWLARGVAVAGIGGVLALSGGAAAFAQGGTGASSTTDPLSSLSKQLQDSSTSLPTLPELDPTQLTELLNQGAKSLPLQLPPLKLPDLSSLTPKTPLICGVTVIALSPTNSNCPGSGQKTVHVTKVVPAKPITRTVTKVVHEPTKVVGQPVNYQQPAAVASGKLAYTGFETTPVLAAGAAALIGGTVLTACARPRKRT
jgi:hypothetical protein